MLAIPWELITRIYTSTYKASLRILKQKYRGRWKRINYSEWFKKCKDQILEQDKLLKGVAALFLLALYVSGVLCQIFTDAGKVSLNPLR